MTQTQAFCLLSLWFCHWLGCGLSSLLSEHRFLKDRVCILCFAPGSQCKLVKEERKEGREDLPGNPCFLSAPWLYQPSYPGPPSRKMHPDEACPLRDVGREPQVSSPLTSLHLLSTPFLYTSSFLPQSLISLLHILKELHANIDAELAEQLQG